MINLVRFLVTIVSTKTTDATAVEYVKKSKNYRKKEKKTTNNQPIYFIVNPLNQKKILEILPGV